VPPQLPAKSSDDMGARHPEPYSGCNPVVSPVDDVYPGSISHPGRTQTHSVPSVVQHLTLALSGHLNRMHHSGLPVPREIDELAIFLMASVRDRQGATTAAPAGRSRHHAQVTNRLLMTKSEVAEQLHVSVRTVERLVAAGRLPQVYVEHSARIRVKDLEFFVESLTESPTPGYTQPSGS